MKQKYPPNPNNKILFKTIVGSHIWNMDTPESDVDEFHAYIVPTTDILGGLCRDNSHFSTKENDIASHEMGVIINQLIKNNINFVTGVSSNFVLYDKDFYRQDLFNILQENISKQAYDSIRGLVVANYNKYILKRSELNNEKRINQMLRNLNYGINLLDTGKIKFTKYTGLVDEIEPMLKEMEIARENSSLPEFSNQKPFREYLKNLRLRELNDEL